MPYIETIYSTQKREQTDYPQKLCRYLCDRFHLTPDMKLLDVGCGRGDFSRAFNLDVFSIDKEETRFHEGLNIDYADLEHDFILHEDEFFDVVFSKSLLEHLANPENFITECHRVLKPNGRIILMVPDWNTQYKIFYDDYTHRTPYTKNSMEDFLQMFGFQNVSSENFYQLPILWQFPKMKLVSKMLQLFVSPNYKIKNKFIRWSVELMVLGTGVKP